MNKNKHLLLWSSLGVLLLLVVAAVRENFLRQWRQIQAAVRTDAGPLPPRLRQIVAPKLGVTDRCVTCHVGMSPGEQGATGHPAAAAHPPIPHDVGQFGCTVCHGGQGRATDMADAHGDVHFWPEPMIPREYAYAGCGSCHTHIRVPNETELARGRNLVEQYDCLACHRFEGRGGTLRPGGEGGMEGPDLSKIGAAGFGPWYERHLEKAKKAESGVWKTNFGPIGEQDRATIEGYLHSRVGAPRLVEAKSLFHSLGCRGCHKVGGVGGDDGPDLTLTGQKDPARVDFSRVTGEHILANWHRQHLQNPAQVVVDSKMPKFPLTEKQLDLLTLYLLSLRRSEVPEAFWPRDRVRAERLGEREFGTDGGTLFGTFCAACHGTTGQGMRLAGQPPFPAVANPDFLAAASDDFLRQTIHRGRPGRRMPAWGEKEGGLRVEEIDAIVAWLRRKAPGANAPGSANAPGPAHAERRWVKADPQAGQQIYTNLCVTCHGAKGEGPDAPALANPALQAAASDDYFFETIRRGRHGTAMNGFGRPSPAYPTLSPSDIESLVAYLRTWEKQ